MNELPKAPDATISPDQYLVRPVPYTFAERTSEICIHALTALLYGFNRRRIAEAWKTGRED